MDKIKIKNLLASPLIIILFTFLCLLAIFSLRESSKKAIISKESIHKLEENVKTEEKNLEKESQKFKIAQDDIALEKIKRNELLQKKEGEIVLQIPEKSELKEEKIDLINEKNGQWQEWKKLLFN